MPSRVRSFIFLLCALLAQAKVPGLCLAEENWTSDSDKQSPAPRNEDRIIRWCSSDGKAVRFASANIEIQGYQPCGELNVPINCDAGGTRIIGKTDKLPYSYKACSGTPRIRIENDGETVSGATGQNGPDGQPLDAREKMDLASDLHQVEQNQKDQADIQIQKLLEGVLGQLLNQVPPQQQKSGSRKGKLGKGEIDTFIRYVDPQQQPKLRQVLENY